MSLINAGSVLGGREAADIKAQIAAKLNTTDAPATVRDTALTGLSTATAAPVTAGDTVLEAAGKLQAQATDNAANSRLRFILTSTWALLPAANSVPTGTRYFVSDIGINGSDWYTDGVRWRLVNGRITLFANNAAYAGTGALSGEFLTFSIPAGVMGATGAIEITTLFSANNNANSKVVRVVYAGVNYMLAGLTSAASCQMMTIIRNRTANSQIGANAGTAIAYGSTAAQNAFTSADSAIAQPVTLNWTLANSADTVTLESVRIDLIA